MRSQLQSLLGANDGVVTRAQLMADVPHHVVDRAVAGETEKVDIELDGSHFHGGERRERDMRRDAALAALGWLGAPVLSPATP